MKLFGTDGIRGVANEDLTPELAMRTGAVLGDRIAKNSAERGFVLLGRDTRKSGEMLASAVAAGILSAGVDVVDLSVIPTPGVAYLVRKYGARAGIVISASHNPYPYNGIKIFADTGYKLPDAVEEEIEAHIVDDHFQPRRAVGAAVGTYRREFTGAGDYEAYLKSLIGGDLKGLKIAIDPGNGALYAMAPRVLTELGAEVIAISTAPDGENINAECGSTAPEKIQLLVKQTGAHIGFSFDGDADRIIAVDETGAIVDGDHILAICAAQLKEKGELDGNTVVGTVMTNIGLDRYLKEQGIDLIKTKVGDRYVLEAMRDAGYVLGGEQSGHIIFSRYNTTGDGLATGLHLLDVLKERGVPMSALNGLMTSYPQVLVNATVDKHKKEAYKEHPGIQKRIREIEARFQDEGRVVIRPSGTEPLVRVMIEGEDQAVLDREARALAAYIEKELQ